MSRSPNLPSTGLKRGRWRIQGTVIHPHSQTRKPLTPSSRKSSLLLRLTLLISQCCSSLSSQGALGGVQGVRPVPFGLLRAGDFG